MASRRLLHCRRRDELDGPIRIISASAVMPGDQIRRRRLCLATALATQALNEVFKSHVALPLDKQLRRIANRTATAVDLDDAVRPIGELVRRTELWRVPAKRSIPVRSLTVIEPRPIEINPRSRRACTASVTPDRRAASMSDKNS